MYRTLSLAILSLVCPLSYAFAGDLPLQSPKGTAEFKVDCTLTSAFNSRPLFLNAGIYASKTPGQITDINCLYQDFYVNVWNLTPYSRSFGDGGEVDVRGGWTKRFGQWGVDISAAWYNYRIDGVGVLNSADVRGKVSYDFLPVNFPAVLQAYGLIDYQHSFDFKPAEALAFAVGAYAGYKVTPKLQVGVSGEIWQYAAHFAPSKTATIYSVVPQIKYLFTDKVTLFGSVGFASGSVVNAQDHGWKQDYIAGFSVKFY
jgi:hypothetical protein